MVPGAFFSACWCRTARLLYILINPVTMIIMLPSRFFLLLRNLLCAAVPIILCCLALPGYAQVSVTATAGATGPSPYTTLKGAFDAINAGTHRGAITVSITGNTTETATASLNASGSGSASYTAVNIAPASGTTPVVSGGISSGPLVKLNGASNVTINGSNNNTTTRDLSIVNTSTTSSNVLQMGSVGSTPITNVMLKNTVLTNGTNTSTAVLLGDAAVVGSPGYYNNITVQNNSIQKAYIGLYCYAVVAAGNGNNTLVTDNDLNSTGANSLRLVGVYVQGATGVTVSDNNIGNFDGASAEFDRAIWLATATTNTTISGNVISGLRYTGTSSYAPIGINISSGVTSSNINITDNTVTDLSSSGTGTTMGIFSYSAMSGVTYSRNKVSNIKNTNTSGYGAAGILMAHTITTAATTIVNNFVWDVASYGFNDYTSSDNGNGIVIDGGGGYNLYFNTVVLNTEQTLTGAHRASALLITANVTASSVVNLRNNILANFQAVGNANSRLVLSNVATSGNAVFSAINYNDYYSTSTNLTSNGTNASITNTLAQVQATIGGNANSLNIQPVFVSANDIHLDPTSNTALNNQGTTIAGITTDIDGDTRGATPDMGADEFSPCTAVNFTLQPVPASTCPGSNARFVVNTSNGTSYRWQVNTGSGFTNITNNAIYSGATNDTLLITGATAAMNGYIYRCAVNAAPCTYNSNAVALSVGSMVTATATPAGATTFCSGGNVTLNAAPTGTGYSYQWLLNGGTIASATSDAYIATASGNYRVLVTATATGCADTSTAVAVTVNPSVVPSVSVAASPGTTICAGTNVTFTATPVNGGGGPAYQWRKNGLNVGTNSATYADNALVNTDVITVRLTSNANCRTLDTVNSMGTTMTVNANVVPSVTVATNPGTTICAGTNVTFTATPVNGGGTPAYQWRKNGLNVGTNSATYADNALVNADVITVRLTSNANCRTLDTVNSTGTTMTVNSNLVPSVTVSANPGTTICAGVNVTFTATPVNGGGTPAYQWRKNGLNVGTNSTTYADNTLSNGDVITVRLTSNANCRTLDTVNSAGSTMTVNANVVPSVTVSANPGTTICAGTNVTFTATPANGGAAPAYQWRKNGTNVGSNSATYSDNTLLSGDIITVRLTSNANCRTLDTVNSTTTTMTVGNVSPQPGAITGNTRVCGGSAQSYSISAVAGATSYTWSLPSGWSGTSSTNSINATAATASGTGVISVIANNGCGPSLPRTLADTVINIPATPGTITGNVAVCGGSAQSYSIAAVTEATAYAWTVPAGWAASSSVLTSMNTTAATATGTGNITVTASNQCGTSPAQSLAVAVSNIPATPAAVSGNVAVCASSAQTYSIAAIPGATSYTWTIPAAGGWTATPTTSNILNATAGTVTGAGTITVSASNFCGTSAVRSLNVNVSNIPAAPGAITGNASICAGSSQPYNVAQVAEATSYTWTIPGTGGWSTVGPVTSNQLSTIAGTQSGNITVTASNFCGTSAPRSIAVTVSTIPLQPGLITGDTNICGGTAQPYSIAAVNQATSYTWTIPQNGWTATGAVSTIVSGPLPSLAAIAGTAGGTISIAASNFCGSSPARSVNVTVTNIPARPGVISGPDSLCAGMGGTFSIGYVNEATAYAWTLPSSGGWSGSSVSRTLNAATTTAAQAGTASVTVRASNFCGVSQPATKNVWITQPVQPTVTIAAANPAACSGQPVIFTATATNGGTQPLYQWRINGQNSGGPSQIPVFNSTSFRNGDVISAVLISNAVCATPIYATSNAIPVQITPTETPGVNINASRAASTLCTGDPVIFTATPLTGGGSSPSFQWRRNGVNVGTNSMTYTDLSLTDGDSVSVIMTSSAACVTVPSAYSNKISVRVWPIVTPSVSISANPGTAIPSGGIVTFTANVTNGGTNPSFQWLKNGQGINGATNSTYTTNTLRNGDVISLQFTADQVCVSGGTRIVVSNGLAMMISTDVNSAGLSAASLQLYPNPNNGRFTVSMKGSQQGRQLKVEILGVLGQVINHTAVTPDRSDWSVDMNLGDIAAGVYMLKVSDALDGRSVVIRRFEVIK